MGVHILQKYFFFSLSLSLLLFIYFACWLFYRENNKPFGFFSFPFISFIRSFLHLSHSHFVDFFFFLTVHSSVCVCASLLCFSFIQLSSSNVILQLDLNIFSVFFLSPPKQKIHGNYTTGVNYMYLDICMCSRWVVTKLVWIRWDVEHCTLVRYSFSAPWTTRTTSTSITMQ